jgi:hypothetical protein
MPEPIMCAHDGCDRPGKRQACFYDGRTHHHGAIHYPSDDARFNQRFLEHGWLLICDEHYQVLAAEQLTRARAS